MGYLLAHLSIYGDECHIFVCFVSFLTKKNTQNLNSRETGIIQDM